MSEAHANENTGYSKREPFYKVGFVVSTIAALVIGIFSAIGMYEAPAPAPEYEIQGQLVDFDPSLYTNEELGDKVKSGQAAVATGYVGMAYACNDLMGYDFLYEKHVSRIEDGKLVVDVDCYRESGGMEKYTHEFDMNTGHVLTKQRYDALQT